MGGELGYDLLCGPTATVVSVFLTGPGVDPKNFVCDEECEPEENFEIPKELLKNKKLLPAGNGTSAMLHPPPNKIVPKSKEPPIHATPMKMRAGPPLVRTMEVSVDLDLVGTVTVPRTAVKALGYGRDIGKG